MGSEMCIRDRARRLVGLYIQRARRILAGCLPLGAHQLSRAGTVLLRLFLALAVNVLRIPSVIRAVVLHHWSVQVVGLILERCPLLSAFEHIPRCLKVQHVLGLCLSRIWDVLVLIYILE